MADPLIPMTAGQTAVQNATQSAPTMTLLNSDGLFDSVKRALKSLGASDDDITAYIDNLQEVLLGEDTTNKSLRATINSLSEKARNELALGMNTTQAVISDTSVGELVKAIQDPKNTGRVGAAVEHAANNAAAPLDKIIARVEKKLPGMTAADRDVLIADIKATEIAGTGTYKYTNQNIRDFNESYFTRANRQRLRNIAAGERKPGAEAVKAATQVDPVDLHIKSLEAKNPEMASLLRDSVKKAEAGGDVVSLDAVKRLQKVAAGGKGFTLKEQGDLIEAARTAESASSTSFIDALPPNTPLERFTRAGVKQARMPIPQDKALARVIVDPEALAVANNIEEAGIYHTLKGAASAERTAATMSPSVIASLKRIGTPAAAELAGTGSPLFNDVLRGTPQMIGTVVPKSAMAMEAAASAAAPSLLRRVAGGVGAVASAHPILSTAAMIGADIGAASVVDTFTAPAREAAEFQSQLRARDTEGLNQLPIDVALKAAAVKNYVSPWEQAMEGRQTQQQLQMQAQAREQQRNAMGLAPGDSIL